MMKKLFTSVALILAAIVSNAQLSVINNDKPLGFLNPAFQNYDLDKGVVSASFVINPLIQETNPADYLALAEFKVSDNFRVGANLHKVENRLNASSSVKAYLSYKLELEKGSYLIFGADAGYYTDEVKLKEFNKVYSPNKFVYEDTTSSGLDVGLGVAYQYGNFMFGIGFSKLNTPQGYDFPSPFYDFSVDTIIIDSKPFYDTTFFYADTVLLTKEGQGNFGLQSNINAVYEWDINENLSLMHSLHFGNVDFSGADYVGFQNNLSINNRHSAGLGIFYNGNTGYMLSGGYGITEDIKLQLTAFFIEDLNYNSTSNSYESDGYKPMLEFNARYHF